MNGLFGILNAMMLPTLTTSRLRLRPFVSEDAPDIQRLANEPLIYETTLKIPHPYLSQDAEKWIATHQMDFEQEKGVCLAIVSKTEEHLLGCISLTLTPQHQRAEMGYWIGVPHWNQGYGTEAAREIVRYGFEDLKLHKIAANHFADNTPSGRIMQKIGMIREGQFQDHFFKDDRAISIVVYGILNPANK